MASQAKKKKKGKLPLDHFEPEFMPRGIGGERKSRKRYEKMLEEDEA